MPDFHFRPETWDRSIFESVVVQNEYLLPDRLEGWVIDGGTHIGSFAYASLARGAARVIGFEAGAENHALACRNLAGFPHVEVRHAALDPSPDGARVLYFTPCPTRGNTGGGSVNPERGEPVPVCSLDRVLSELPGQGLLKLDCEGSEYGIVEHSKLLKDKVHTIVGEMHYQGQKGARLRCRLLKNRLERLGYRVALRPWGPQTLFLACQGGLWPGWKEGPLYGQPAQQADHILRFMGLDRWPDPCTFGLFCPGFGDIWRTVQYACWVQATRQAKVSLYTAWHGLPGKDFSETPLANKEGLIREILEALDFSGTLELTQDPPAERYFPLAGVYPFFAPNVPTRQRWQGTPGKRFRRIAYQLDGVSCADQKNPPQADLEALLSFAPGHEFVRLGKHLSVRQCLEAASTCDFFFGVDSGMQQLCYAAGVPAFLLRYGQDRDVLDVWHGRRHAIHCADTRDFLLKARAFLALD
ncbi:MAG: FkbM family methyltransferase [Planctomycetota bacterium]|nr:FkbM family methyltransferase [Planctomycetota bacterium]